MQLCTTPLSREELTRAKNQLRQPVSVRPGDDLRPVPATGLHGSPAASGLLGRLRGPNLPADGRGGHGGCRQTLVPAALDGGRHGGAVSQFRRAPADRRSGNVHGRGPNAGSGTTDWCSSPAGTGVFPWSRSTPSFLPEPLRTRSGNRVWQLSSPACWRREPPNTEPTASPAWWRAREATSRPSAGTT